MQRTVCLLLLVGCVSAVPAARAQDAVQSVTGNKIACTNGVASAFSCNGVDLMAFLRTAEIGGEQAIANDIWGWADPDTGREYALVGRSDGTAFVDVSDPINPVFVGLLPTATVGSLWRDIKVYADHAFIVADNVGTHGVQIFNLAGLREATDPPVTFSETTIYSGIGSAHNIAINEETGFAYAVGSNTCGGGLHMINIQRPTNPTFAGCFNDTLTGRIGTGYTHDAQCVVYRGPDAEHEGKEICFGANETALSIADVTNKSNPVAVSRATYPNVGYTHQGWLTEDHQYFLIDDELDEIQFGAAVKATRTLIWDVTDLDDPQLVKQHSGHTRSSDHNLYVVGDYVFQANYTTGLRILDIADIEQPREVAFFDTDPFSDDPGFSGAWSVYPFFESGTVVVSSMREGVFVLQPTALRILTSTEAEAVPEAFALAPAYPNPFNPQTTLTLTLAQAQWVRVAAYDVLGREVGVLVEGMLPQGPHSLTFEAAGLPSGTYLIRAINEMAIQTQRVLLAK